MNYWYIVLGILIFWNIIAAAIVYITVLPKIRKFWYGIYWLTIFGIIIDLGILYA